MIFKILVSLENVKKCVWLVARLVPQRLKSTFFEKFSNGAARENETKNVKITHSVLLGTPDTSLRGRSTLNVLNVDKSGPDSPSSEFGSSGIK